MAYWATTLSGQLPSYFLTWMVKEARPDQEAFAAAYVGNATDRAPGLPQFMVTMVTMGVTFSQTLDAHTPLSQPDILMQAQTKHPSHRQTL